jgi:hypothetical protein
VPSHSGPDAPARDPTCAFDPSVPHPARVYNVWLGGKDHYAADREVAARVISQRPEVVGAARANRQFLGRVVRYLARCQGIRQFIDIGTGLPAPGNTHEVAQQADVWSRVVYVDNDPLVMSHARALLTSTDEGCCGYLQADLRDTGTILREARRTLDFGQPVAVLLLTVLHFIPDADGPAGIVAALTEPLAPGSCVAISHLTADFAPDAVGGGVRAYNALVPTAVVPRSHAQVTGLFAGLPLAAPGVVPVTGWRPDQAGAADQAADLYGGVARIPAGRWRPPLGAGGA